MKMATDEPIIKSNARTICSFKLCIQLDFKWFSFSFRFKYKTKSTSRHGRISLSIRSVCKAILRQIDLLMHACVETHTQLNETEIFINRWFSGRQVGCDTRAFLWAIMFDWQVTAFSIVIHDHKFNLLRDTAEFIVYSIEHFIWFQHRYFWVFCNISFVFWVCFYCSLFLVWLNDLTNVIFVYCCVE